MDLDGPVKRLASVLALGLLAAVLPVGPAALSQAAPPSIEAATSLPAPPHGPVYLPDEGALFGAHVPVDAHTGPDRQSAVTTFEQMSGRKMALERVFYRWDAAWPSADDEWSRDQGRTLVISWNAGRSDGTFTKWADIAAGLHDTEIDARAAAAQAFGAPFVFVFNHEPNNGNSATGQSAGTAPEFQDAFRYIHDRFLAQGVTNVSFGLVLMAWTFRLGDADVWYPGDAYVDILGADGYNWYGCNGFSGSPWATVQTVFTDFHDFGVAHNKAMIVAEWASGEDSQDPDRKAQWIRDGAAVWKSWPEIKGIAWFNTATNPGCPRYVDTTAQSQAAWVEIGADAYFNPTSVMSITAGPAAVTDATAATFTFSSSRTGAATTCALDGAAPVACTSPHTVPGLSAGSHTMDVRGANADGTAGSPATWRWSITGPVTTISSGPPAATTATSATFGWTSTQPGATYACSLDGAAPSACTSTKTYTALATGAHTFNVTATRNGISGPAAGWTWSVVAVGASVTVNNTAYSPKAATVGRGTAARWTFTTTSPQSVVDTSGMALFDSGLLSGGAVYEFVFLGAGIYKYGSASSARTGTITVPMSASPSSGTTGSTFTITWASTAAPAGYVYDVQLKRPSATTWSTWQNGVTTASSSYAPDGGVGTYSFRARLKKSANSSAASWSPVVTVSVS